MNSYANDDLIAAAATPQGKGALALIRLSGKGSIEAAAEVFSRPEKLLRSPGNTIVHGWILGPSSGGQGGKLDEVMVSVYRAPHSYTGEDSLEISCHGGIASAAVLAALRRSGFRDALPGEFSFRAFMNGKMDLSRSESVMELVSAKTDRGRSNAVGRLSGVLEDEINGIKKLLLEVLAETELYLDYSEDEADAAAGEAAGDFPGREKAEEAGERLQKLSLSWRRERLYQDGALVVIAGLPNAGKSSIFNLLLREERSIVTEIPGTTRDWIEAWLSIEGIPVRLIDTAGLRDSGDPVESLGVERSRELLESADLRIYVIDGEKGLQEEDLNFLHPEKTTTEFSFTKNLIVLWNKLDRAKSLENMRFEKKEAAPETAHGISLRPFPFSARTGEGMAELLAAVAGALRDTAGETEETEGPGLGTRRQKDLVDGALASLNEALNLAKQHEALDLIAPCLREAVNALGEITGEVSNADMLELMFSTFCVGK
ncbi:MAG: tRNA uridine-5-carboxymethylaminomethyl(34) synthesis GTPase MnmE [Treponema sp.]|jgi:tRNA modification GTPase|nr:tRNA uridine-5-carboxymethylaminomethyl(34) synthesis GTPase MnmE [Treponema sp.]